MKSQSSVLVSLQIQNKPLKMSLFDHRKRLVAEGYGEIERRLQQGLYLLEIFAGPHLEHLFFEVGDDGYTDHNISVDVPSIAPVGGGSTTHEFHSAPASELSRQPNCTFGTGGRLVVFVRSLGDNPRQAVNINGLELIDRNQKKLGHGEQSFENNGQHGWAGISADVDPGGYILRQSRPSRGKINQETTVVDQSIWVEEGWTTLVFVPCRNEVKIPEPEFASIYMTRIDSGFQPYDFGTQAANIAYETALSALRQGRAEITREFLNLLLKGKFINPMLGFVGALILLNSPKMKWKLFNEVMGNLKKLTPNHPDVKALTLMAKQRRGEGSRTRGENISWPPMLSAGYQAAIAREADEGKNLISPNSLADYAATALFSTGPWTRWRSLKVKQPSPRKPAIRSKRRGGIQNLKSLNMFTYSAGSTNVPSFEPIPSPSRKTWREDEEIKRVSQYLREVKKFQNKFPKEAENQKLSLERIGKATGLTRSAVTRALKVLG